MLHTKTVEPNTLSILKELMALPELQIFSLVGGTALSLLFGHRTSIDLDLFSNQPFQNDGIVAALREKYGKDFIMEQKPPHFGIFCFIRGVKVDFVRHPHPLIGPLQIKSEIRIFSLEDIAAMKVQAILGRGRKKDFWDVAELLNHFEVKDFVAFHNKKYIEQTLMISVPQAITYFADAHDDDDPKSFKQQTWQSVQQTIQQQVTSFLKWLLTNPKS